MADETKAPANPAPEQTGLDRLLSSKESDLTESLKVSEAVGVDPDAKTPETTQEPLKAETPAPTAEQAIATGEVPPTPEEKPPEKPVEVKPAEPTEEPRQQPTWRMLRQMQKQIEALQKARDTPPAAPKTDETPADDALDSLGVRPVVKTEVDKVREETRAELAQIRATEELNRIRQQEDMFRATQPHYNKAVDWLIDDERKRFIRMGGDRYAGHNLSEAAKLDTPEGKYVKAEIDKIAEQKDCSDEEAAREYAARLWVGQQRNLLIQGANAQGRPIPELAWEEATSRGFKAIEETPAAPAAANGQAPATPTPQAKVEQARRVNEVAPSLSEMNLSTKEPVMKIQNKKQLLALASSDMPAFTKYCLERVMDDPDWHKSLPDG